MLCEQCKQREATVHMTQVVNGHKTESHLCSECAHQQQGAVKGAHPFGTPLFDDSFFSNHFFTNALYPDAVMGKQTVARCPHCGMSFDEFNHVGKFGCDTCYETFGSSIVPLVKRLQQNAMTYEGKVPSRGNGVFKTKHQIKRLRQQLTTAVKQEDFEKAAILRDQIRELEQSLSSTQEQQ